MVQPALARQGIERPRVRVFDSLLGSVRDGPEAWFGGRRRRDCEIPSEQSLANGRVFSVRQGLDVGFESVQFCVHVRHALLECGNQAVELCR